MTQRPVDSTPDDFTINLPTFSLELSLTSLGVRERQPVVWDTLDSKPVWNPDSLPGIQIAITLERGVLELELNASSLWSDDVAFELRVHLQEGIIPESLFWASYLGRLVQRSSLDDVVGVFYGAGKPASWSDIKDSELRLSIPMAVLCAANRKWLIGSDPEFSTSIRLEHVDGQSVLVYGWTWLAAAGQHSLERRRFLLQPIADERTALDKWFELATPEIPAGPTWLHDIAFQNYDFLSKDGQGWYQDIDAACTWIAPEDRHRVLFCLHGWYDEVGAYCFDTTTRMLKQSWLAFPHVNHPDVLAKSVTATDTKLSSDGYSYRNLERYQPVQMDWIKIRDRLDYAKQRGFRTAFYLMTGLQASGDKTRHVAEGTGLELDGHLWTGPDAVGATYVRNPLNPQVQKDVLDYLAALLEQVGDLVDALAYDEAYYIPFGTLGPAKTRGYADRAQAHLLRDMTAMCHRCNPNIALLTADLLGYPALEQQAFPYSLFADGIYQDSHGHPQTWSAVRFPAWRNVAWGCNWAPITNLELIRYGVLAHDATIAWGNGCFGDDTGLAEINEVTRKKLLSLWQSRMRQARSRTLPIARQVYAGTTGMSEANGG